MPIDQNKMKRFILTATILYLSFGFIFALYAYSHDLRTFKCGDVTMGTKSFKNPDSERCVRRGTELSSIATIPFFTAFGVPILIARGMAGNN